MSYFYIANASFAIGWFQPLLESYAFAITSGPITLILKPEPGNSVYYDDWTPQKTPTLNVCSGRKRKEKIQYARDKAESQWCEYAEGV